MMRAELALSALLLAAAADARPRASQGSSPGADELILRALAGPATGYTGLQRVQIFRPGAKPRGLTVQVSARPGGFLRREAKPRRRKPSGWICVRDGRRTRLFWPARGRLWSAPESTEAPSEGLARLRALYEISVSTGGRVAKRSTWRVDLRAPGGGLRGSLWVDRSSGLLLKRETYRPDGPLSRRERFTRLVLPADPEAGLFVLDAPAGTAILPWTAPQAALRAEAPPSTSWSPRLPRWLPDGYLLVDVRAPSPREVVAVYSDGASRAVLRQVPSDMSPRPVGRNPRSVRLGAREFVVSEADEGGVLSFRSGDRAFLFEGDLADDEWVRMAQSLEEPR